MESRIVSLHYLNQQGIEQTLNLPLKDKKRLSGLMQKLFAEDCFAYTLLGMKPVSWESHLKPFPFSNLTRFYDSFSTYHRTIRAGWKTWEKYKHLFPSAPIWLECSKSQPAWNSILIVNEAQLQKTIIKNKKDFQAVLGREIENELELINEAKNGSLLDETLQGHQALIGIVLGYGRDNAWHFLEGCKNKTSIGWVWEDEEDYFLQESEDSSELRSISCPSFAGDPISEESLLLKEQYLMTRQKVAAYYKDKDFLEATLSLLAGYRPE